MVSRKSESEGFYPSYPDISTAVGRFETLLNTIQDGVYQLDNNGRFVAVNDVIVETTGYSRDQLIDNSVEQILDEHDLDRVQSEIRSLLRTEAQLATLDVTVHTATGDQKPCEIRLSILRENGEFVGTVGVARDISKRLEYERALERDKERVESELEEIFGRVSDGFFSIDEEFRFTHINERAEQLLDRPIEELLGTVFWDSIPKFSAAHELQSQFSEAMETQEDISLEIYNESTEDWFEATAYPSSTGLSIYFRDITDRKERETALERYETIVETITDGVYVLDENYHFTLVNEAYLEMTGYSRDKLIGSHCSLVVGGEVSSDAAERSMQLAQTDDDYATIEANIHRADGELLPGESRFVPLVSDDGEYQGSVGVVRDLTHRKERERVLEESERRYRTLVEQFPNGVVALFDRDLQYTAAGGELLAEFSQEVGDPVGDTITDRYPSDILRKVEPYFRAALAGESNSFEIEYIGRHLHARIVPITDSANEVFSGMLMVQDITERKEREIELERYETIIETINDGIYTVDETGRFTWVNSRYADMLGYEQDELIGKPVSTVVDERIAERAQRVERKMIDDSIDIPTLEAQLIRADGTTFSAEATFALFDTNEGYERVGVARDISERKQQEQKLREQREQLTALNRFNETFREISHAVIDSTDPDSIEQLVCDLLVEHYQFAWIGKLDPRNQSIIPRTVAGNENGFLQEICLSVDQNAYCTDHPTTVAALTQRAAFLRDVGSICENDGWITAAKDRGFNAIAAVPIAYDDRMFGILTIYSSSAEGFDEIEQEILSHVGDVIGHAIYSVDQHRALISDAVIELDFRSVQLANLLVAATHDGNGNIIIDRTIPGPNNSYILFLTLTGFDLEKFQSVASDFESITHFSVISQSDTELRLEITGTDFELLDVIQSFGGHILEFIVQENSVRVRSELPRHIDIRSVVESIREIDPSIEVLAQRTNTRQPTSPHDLHDVLVEGLTDRQRTAIETAYFAGYFDWPRANSGSDVATLLDLSPATFTEHLRRAQAKIFDEIFETCS